MAQRYVRVQTAEGRIYYGLLELTRSVTVLDAPPWLKGQPTGEHLEAETYSLLSPCSPSKIIAVGKNYPEHAAEMHSEVPQEPLIFLKPPTAVIACDSPIFYPPQTQELHYEGELALVIGEKCFSCSPQQAQAKIWGYTIANDITARDLQRQDRLWTRAKGFDTFCPLGPWIVRELAPGARLQTFLNNHPTPVQSANLEEMVYSPEILVSYISQIMTLLPGDVILTGTPAGVGAMAIGDQICVEIEGIGKLKNHVTARE